MLFIDDIVFSPVRGVLSIFKEIYKAAAQEMANEGDAIRTELARLYQMLESGAIGDQQFDDLEKDLLDRLDAIEARAATFGDADEDEVDEEEDEDDSENDFDSEQV